MKTCRELIAHLKKKGVIIDDESASLLGYSLRGYYPLGERKASFAFLFSSLSKKARLHLEFPTYTSGDQEMVDAYDRFFPKEKNQWGRSTPSFRQAIKDYMRGQDLCPAERRNFIEIDEERGSVVIRLVAKGKSMGLQGMVDAYRKIQYELEQGQIHRDVLTHLFAF